MNKGFACIAMMLIAPVSAYAQSNGSNPVSNASSATNHLAMSLYGRLAASDGNIFFSPFSIETALAMTYAGARGATAEEMASTLGFANSVAVHESFKTLLDSLEANVTDSHELSIANALWLQRDYEFLPTYLSLAKDRYGAGLSTLDFVGNTEGARGAINSWVESKTRDKIKELLKPGILSADTRLVLTNAIYFKGKWQRQFDPKATSSQPFHISAANSVDVPTMQLKASLSFATLDGVSLLELPYDGDKLSMLIVLPAEREGLPALEKQLSTGNLEAWTKELKETEVDVSLPKFKATSEFRLDAQLQALGMRLAFLSDADFSGMTGKRDLAISAVIHKAYADVNEEGTEAAAATAVAIVKMMARPTPTFVADHPFIYVIRHKPTGTILFMGRLVEPGQG